MKKNLKISFIGGGNMAAALVGGLAGKLTEAKNIHIVDINPETLGVLKERFGVSTAVQIDAAVAMSDVIVLAVKPQQMREVLVMLAPQMSDQLVLSIAAGIRMQDLSRWLNGHAAIVRTMPNTPALIGQGVTGMVAMSGVKKNQREVADVIMKAVGQTLWIEDEFLIDAITAVSGSGPAYVFYFIEAMEKAAGEMGLTAAQGRQLAIATFVGSAQLAAKPDESVSILRERVTSKGGTTYAALSSMEASGVADAVRRAMKTAAARSKEIGDELGEGG